MQKQQQKQLSQNNDVGKININCCGDLAWENMFIVISDHQKSIERNLGIK